MREAILTMIACLLIAGQMFALEAEIAKKSGDVKVRRGVEEHWENAGVGMLLKEIDTIITGEAGDVILKIEDGPDFRLGANAILDISDLRKISKQQLYVYLTQQKLNQIEKRDEKSNLNITNVSVVHGSSKDTVDSDILSPEEDMWLKEKNGVKALYDQSFYPNTIIKLHRTFGRYADAEDCGELNYDLGHSLEQMEQTGQAVDAYKKAVSQGETDSCGANGWSEAARMCLERLKE